MKPKAQAATHDDFWTQDIPLFTGVFRFYHHKPRPMRAKIHTAEERYTDGYHEIVPLSAKTGVRHSVLLQPYVFAPKLTLTIGLYKKPKVFADQEPAIGETVGPIKQEGVTERQIGNSQAWYYPEDRLLVLWECFLEEFVRDLPVLEDPNMPKLWESVEYWLLQQFPKTVEIATPWSDPLFPTRDYQQFLRSRGFEQAATAAFTKRVK